MIQPAVSVAGEINQCIFSEKPANIAPAEPTTELPIVEPSRLPLPKESTQALPYGESTKLRGEAIKIMLSQYIFRSLLESQIREIRDNRAFFDGPELFITEFRNRESRIIEDFYAKENASSCITKDEDILDDWRKQEKATYECLDGLVKIDKFNTGLIEAISFEQQIMPIFFEDCAPRDTSCEFNKISTDTNQKISEKGEDLLEKGHQINEALKKLAIRIMKNNSEKAFWSCFTFSLETFECLEHLEHLH